MTPQHAGVCLHWILRVGCVMCYLGHGAFGLITKAAWVPYFGVAGISEEWAWKLMPVVGAVDITMGLLVAVRPTRVVLLYMTLWSFWTALLRPLAGEPFWETLERAGNYGVPLAFLLLAGPAPFGEWFARIRPAPLPPAALPRLAWTLRLTTALLLIGHAGFGAVMHKQALEAHYAAAGLGRLGFDLTAIVTAVGWFELALGAAILIRPFRALLLLALVWKLATEMLYPLSGTPIWEFIERGGSYAVPLALLLLVPAATRARPGANPALPN